MGLDVHCVPPLTAHTHTIIFLHGRDSTARAFCDELFESQDSYLRYLRDIFPTARWLFPQAESRHSKRFEEDIHQWFDIWDVANPGVEKDLQLPGLRESVLQIVNLIRVEATTVGGLRNIVLAGISQGVVIAIHALFNIVSSEEPATETRDGFCAVIGLSSWMSIPADSISECRLALGFPNISASDQVARNTPIFLSHCTTDEVVPIDQGRMLRDVLKSYGMNVTWKDYYDGGHWVQEPDGIDDIVRFLKSQGLTEAPRPTS
jgi:predicted esterase